MPKTFRIILRKEKKVDEHKSRLYLFRSLYINIMLKDLIKELYIFENKIRYFLYSEKCLQIIFSVKNYKDSNQ